MNSKKCNQVKFALTLIVLLSTFKTNGAEILEISSQRSHKINDKYVDEVDCIKELLIGINNDIINVHPIEDTYMDISFTKKPMEVYVRNNGNCCWHIFNYKNCRGENYLIKAKGERRFKTGRKSMSAVRFDPINGNCRTFERTKKICEIIPENKNYTLENLDEVITEKANKTTMKPTDWCFEENVFYIGLGLHKPGGFNNYGQTGSAQACQLLCQQTEGCGWFNWEKNLDKCWLKTGKGDKILQKPGGVTGPRICPTDWCFEKHIHYIGLGLPKPGGDNNYGQTGSAKACQLLCQQTEGCGWFNWHKNVDKCWLKTGKGDKISEKAGGVTGPRICPTNRQQL